MNLFDVTGTKPANSAKHSEVLVDLISEVIGLKTVTDCPNIVQNSGKINVPCNSKENPHY